MSWLWKADQPTPPAPGAAKSNESTAIRKETERRMAAERELANVKKQSLKAVEILKVRLQQSEEARSAEGADGCTLEQLRLELEQERAHSKECDDAVQRTKEQSIQALEAMKTKLKDSELKGRTWQDRVAKLEGEVRRLERQLALQSEGMNFQAQHKADGTAGRQGGASVAPASMDIGKLQAELLQVRSRSECRVCLDMCMDICFGACTCV